MACRTTCAKRRYETPVDAMLALERIQKQRKCDALTKHERTYYYCADHECYHLTSWRTETG